MSTESHERSLPRRLGRALVTAWAAAVILVCVLRAAFALMDNALGPR